MKLFLIFIFCTLLTSADDKIYALLKPLQTNTKLTPIVVAQIQKIGIQTISTKKEFTILFGGSNAPTSSLVDIVSVETEINKKDDRFNIEVRIFDLKRKIILNSALIENVREDDLLRIYQSALEKAFTEKRIIQIEKESTAIEGAEIKKKEQIKSQKLKISSPDVQVNNPKAEQIDFKKILQGLKSEIADKLKAESEKSINENKEKDKNKVAQENQLQKSSDEQSSIKPKVKESNSIPFLPRKYYFEIGYQTRSQENKDLVITRAKANFLSIRANIIQPLRFFQGRGGLQFPIHFYRAISTPADLPIQYLVGMKLFHNINQHIIYTSLDKENSFFFNVTDAGAGLKAAYLETTWFKVGGDYTFKQLNNLKLSGEIGTPFIVNTGYKPVKSAKKWSGQTRQIKITLPLLDTSWESSIMYESNQLQTNGDRLFSLLETRYSLLVGRSL